MANTQGDARSEMDQPTEVTVTGAEATGAHNCFMCTRTDSADNLVGCDDCSAWAHFDCAGVNASVKDKSWKCNTCCAKDKAKDPSKARSRTSRRSSRVDENLQMLEEQQQIELQALDEEEAERRAFRRKRVAIKQDYVKQKYDVRREGSPSDRSDRSNSSGGRSRRIVEGWLTQEPVKETAERVKAWEFPPPPTTNKPRPHAKSASTLLAKENAIVNMGSPPAIPLVPKSASTPYPSTTHPPIPAVVLPSLCGSLSDLRIGTLHTTETSRSRLVPRVSLPETFQQAQVSSSATHLGEPTSISLTELTGHLPFSASKGVQYTDISGLPVSFDSLSGISGIGDPMLPVGDRRPLSAIPEEQGIHTYPVASSSSIVNSQFHLSGEHTYRDSRVAHSPYPSYVPINNTARVTWITQPGNSVPIPTVTTGSYQSKPSVPIANHGPVSLTRRNVQPFLNHPEGAVPQNVNSTTDFQRPEMGPTEQIIQHQGVTNSQLAARQIMNRELPTFTGNPYDWPLFFGTFRNSTESCGFTHAENLARLQRCLQGEALEAVKSKLQFPDSVPYIMDTLQMLYGRPEILLFSMLQKLRRTPPPKQENLRSLITYGLAVKNAVDEMSVANLVEHIWNPMLLFELVEKLPPPTKMEWARYKRQFSQVNLATFSDFMSEQIETASDVVMPYGMPFTTEKTSKTGRDKQKLNVHLENSTVDEDSEGDPTPSKRCSYCNDPSHEVIYCGQFQTLDLDGRWAAVKRRGMCQTCLVPHKKGPCRSRRVCGVEGCRNRHHALLHSGVIAKNARKTEEPSRPQGECSYQNHHYGSSFVLFRYLPVNLHHNGKSVKTFAFLDDGSSSTLMDASIATKLGITGPVDPLWLTWTSDVSREEKESRRISVQISGQNSATKFMMKNVRTVKQLKLPEQSFNYNEMQEDYPHLKGLPLSSYMDVRPMLIVGIEHVSLLTPVTIREGRHDEPIAAKTRLGWCVYGKQMQTPNDEVNIHVHLEQQFGNQQLHDLLGRFLKLEETLVVKDPESTLEKGALEILQQTTRRVGNRFETGLLWKFKHRCFPDTYPTAARREASLNKRLLKDPELYEVVRAQIANYLKNGYAHKITNKELNETNPDKIWYLPLGIVRNPKKPEKVRLIWDAAAKTNGVSLNDMLMKGPDMVTSLPVVLLRFRQRTVAICGDIKEMFHQVNIRAEDKQAQRFLFRDQNEETPQTYVMDVATFGASCSPCIAQYIKNKNAEEFAAQYPRAADAIVNRHYVDDYLASVDTIDEAVRQINEVRHVHALGGFEIRNFLSNAPEVLEKIGVPYPHSIKHLNLEPGVEEPEKAERVLGMMWKPQQDFFTFSTSMQPAIEQILKPEHTPTKREVLRTVMSLFDPLGLIAHFVVHGKIIMQELWKYGSDWDDTMPEELREKWHRWTELLAKLNEVSVPRYFFPGIPSVDLNDLQLHVFVDASESAFASVAYLRIISNGHPHCVLVSAKTKVAPLKPISMPRSELQAALMGARMIETLSETLELPISRKYLWSDSNTVLAWLRSDSRRYHQFVTFRVGEILAKTSISEWHYVPSKQNVADDATKWGNGPSFSPTHRWFSGPEFLNQSEESWPSHRKNYPLPEDELRSAFLHHDEAPFALINVTRFTQWTRLLRVTASVLRAAKRFKKASIYGVFSAVELLEAETFLWKQTQLDAYPEEYLILQGHLNGTNSEQIPKSSALYIFSPFMDQAGVIRMDSRIGAAPSTAVETKYPIILPKNHHLTNLLIFNYHQLFLHRNNETVCNEIHQKFRIPNLRVAVRRVAKNCMLCRIRKARPRPPRMAPLPAARLTPYIKPFTHTGVDYFGPLLAKQGRSLVKRWVCLFTCLTIRAVHVEIVCNLSTSSCILAIRRFIARRGSPSFFYSDNGTNFRGASNILRETIQNISKECAVTFTNTNTQWYFNPPLSPHMGGSWERMVRSIKEAMEAIGNHKQHPSDEVLETVALEAESIVNSRPLTYVPLDHADAEALTPNHFLLYGEKGIVQPPSTIHSDVRMLRDSWRLAQTLTDIFWSRWIKEYLPTIARRTKWFDSVKPLEAGDLVILVNKNHRNGWERGRLLEVYPGTDGQVRQALVQTSNGIIRRPATSLALLDVRAALPTDDRKSPRLHGEEDVDEPTVPISDE
ncbi:uncharacterized protein LOC129752852 [Uranotaenia lowii]|uniref:uncharacterized protein LOC129752852 n=2 Tax=Uranotaenia lowii TaxID=190385 RepID=UPI00247A0F17|nr:uncharacterized protein LOC129752852 [Uranotaenia lowii]